MNIIFQNQYITIYIDQDKSLINDVWQPTSATMSITEFKEILTTWRDCIVEQKLSKSLIDARAMAFVVDPETQGWIAENINAPARQAGLQKVATILPASIFEKVALEQTMSEFDETEGFQRKMFSDEKLAKEWLEL